MLRKKIFILSFLFLFIVNFNVAYANSVGARNFCVNIPSIDEFYYFVVMHKLVSNRSSEKFINPKDFRCKIYFIDKNDIDTFVNSTVEENGFRKLKGYGFHIARVDCENSRYQNFVEFLKDYAKGKTFVSSINFSEMYPKIDLKSSSISENTGTLVKFLRNVSKKFNGGDTGSFVETNLFSEISKLRSNSGLYYSIFLIDTNYKEFEKYKIKKFYYNNTEYYDLEKAKIGTYVIPDDEIKPSGAGGGGGGGCIGGCNYKKEDLNPILEFLSKILEILQNLSKKDLDLNYYLLNISKFLENIDKSLCDLSQLAQIRENSYKCLVQLEKFMDYILQNCELLKEIRECLDKLDFSNLKNLDFSNLKNLDMYIKNILDVNKNILNTSKDILKTNKNILEKFEDFKKELLEQLEKMYKVMLMLDKDDDHPDLFSIYTTNEQILQLLQKKLPNFKNFNPSAGGGGTGGGDDGWGHATLYLYNYFKDLAYIEDLLAEINKKDFVGKMIGDLSNCQPVININNDLSSIKNFIKEAIGNKEDLDKAQKNMEDSFKNLMNQEPFTTGKNTKNAFDNLNNNFNTNKKMSKVSVDIPNIGNMTVFDLELWRPEVDLIRKILACIVWISLFIYFVRVFIPKLKI